MKQANDGANTFIAVAYQFPKKLQKNYEKYLGKQYDL